jgi:hypothetical protein
MPFSLTRRLSVDEDLAAIWIAAADRDAVAAASDQIDQMLRFAPDSVGEDRGAYRVVTVAPLTALYTFSLDDCMVTILQIQLADVS